MCRETQRIVNSAPRMSCFDRVICLLCALAVTRLLAPWWCGREADRWFRGHAPTQQALAEELVAWEADDDQQRRTINPSTNRFAGEWALVTHQMTALGLAQLCLAQNAACDRYKIWIARAAEKTLLPEMRDFGTRAWNGEDALASLNGDQGHAYLAYPALAVSMARLVHANLSPATVSLHDALIAAYERRLLASPTGLIETYPEESYPTDVAAVAAAIAVHGRATGVDHQPVLAHWAGLVQTKQLDPTSGLLFQRMEMRNARPHDAPRSSGTGLAAYFAGFADRKIATQLAAGLFRHEVSFGGFGAIHEYALGHNGEGDIDSGPVVLGVSVAATGFALAPARALGRWSSFERLYRTTEFFGVTLQNAPRRRFAMGGAIGNALLLAFLTSGPEMAP